MKDTFIIWIVLQLMMVGYVTVDTLNQITEKTYDCHKHDGDTYSPLAGVLAPIVAFVPEHSWVSDYCDETPEAKEAL